MRDIITLACTECKRRNYSTTKNKKKDDRAARVEQVLPLLPQAHGTKTSKQIKSGHLVIWSSESLMGQIGYHDQLTR